MSSINRDYLIFPLSCDPALEETEEREIYYKYLDSAFDEPRIHNIGIAGGFGVGKSSLLRSYEKRYLRMANLKMEIKGADGKIIRADLGESIRQGDIIEI